MASCGPDVNGVSKQTKELPSTHQEHRQVSNQLIKQLSNLQPHQEAGKDDLIYCSATPSLCALSLPGDVDKEARAYSWNPGTTDWASGSHRSEPDVNCPYDGLGGITNRHVWKTNMWTTLREHWIGQPIILLAWDSGCPLINQPNTRPWLFVNTCSSLSLFLSKIVLMLSILSHLTVPFTMETGMDCLSPYQKHWSIREQVNCRILGPGAKCDLTLLKPHCESGWCKKQLGWWEGVPICKDLVIT